MHILITHMGPYLTGENSGQMSQQTGGHNGQVATIDRFPMYNMHFKVTF